MHAQHKLLGGSVVFPLGLAKITRLTTFSRSQRDSIDTQVFSDPTQKMVTFEDVENWVIGEDNVIRYTLPFDLEDAGNDWVGVFKVSGFRSISAEPLMDR